MVQEIIDNFHKLYYNSLVWDHNTTWMGVRTEKCPLDLWIYQEIIFRTRPDLIIETGTLEGGTTFFLAHLFDIIGFGNIVSVDITEFSKRKNLVFHPRIAYIVGDSTSGEVLSEVRSYACEGFRILVILDSDHSYPHVLKELELYSQFVTLGNYLIVEDTNLNGNPVVDKHGPGPMEAVQEFLKTNKDFEIDLECEKFFMTFNPKGYLKRIK